MLFMPRRSCAACFNVLLQDMFVAMASRTTCSAWLCSNACNLGPAHDKSLEGCAAMFTVASATRHSSQPCKVVLMVLSAAMMCCSSNFSPLPSTHKHFVAATTSDASAAKRFAKTSWLTSVETGGLNKGTVAAATLLATARRAASPCSARLLADSRRLPLMSWKPSSARSANFCADTAARLIFFRNSSADSANHQFISASCAL
mmetsp:Transcript_16127/g.37044  ORF Transcript_16127/g.37044 Transcript_16127/m.37044 type:complete len:203 (+) Transcript_16127:1995-2603(+)